MMKRTTEREKRCNLQKERVKYRLFTAVKILESGQITYRLA